MPSESGLMRCWFGAKAACHFTRARVIVALPGDVSDSMSSVSLMKKELTMRGVDGNRILFEKSGANTRAEALNVLKNITDDLQTRDPSANEPFIVRHVSILLVTSPEHLVRAVMTFKKAGFKKVDGLPTFEKTIESDLTFVGKTIGGRKLVYDVGNNITIRYQCWMQMNYELLVMREFFALAYYKLQGWI